MLNAAVLRALSQIEPRLPGVDPHRVRVVGNQVSLPRQHWHPKAVVRICRKQFELSRSSSGHVQFIRSDNLQTRIAVFPPELVAYYGDMKGIGRNSVLHVS